MQIDIVLNINIHRHRSTTVHTTTTKTQLFKAEGGYNFLFTKNERQ